MKYNLCVMGGSILRLAATACMLVAPGCRGFELTGSPDSTEDDVPVVDMEDERPPDVDGPVLPTGPLRAVWGGSPSDVYAFGSSFPAKIHFDGESWAFACPCLSLAEGWTYDIWGSSSSDVFFAGGNVAHPIGGGDTVDVLWHSNGSNWSPVIFFDSPDERWREMWGLWGRRPGIAYAVGEISNVDMDSMCSYITRIDGSSWSVMEDCGFKPLRAVWGSSEDAIWAVGLEGTIVGFDGGAWRSVASGTDNDLFGIWGSSATDVHAVGALGSILHFDGDRWIGTDSGTDADLRSVWGVSSDEIYAVGKHGTVLRFGGRSWEAVDGGTDAHLFDVWGSSGENIYAVGERADGSERGAIIHFDGSVWREVPDLPEWRRP